MPASRVYVGRLSYRARESDIERFFRGYGKIRDVMLKNGYCFVEFDDDRDADDAVHDLSGKELLGDRVVIEHARGTPRGPGGNFVRDYDPPPRRSYSSGGGGYYGGGGGGGSGGYRSSDRDRSGRSSKGYGPPRNTDHRLIVENLSSRVSWQDLKDYMRQAGEVTFADANRYRKNEGVIEFATYDDMKEALEKLDNTELNGRKIRLIEDTRSKKSYSRSRSRERSRRSRSRSRSRSSRKRSRSDDRKRSRSGTHSKSRSPVTKKRSSERRSHSRSGSEDRSQEDRMNGDENGRERSSSPVDNDRSPARSNSSYKDKSVSRSPTPN